MNENQLESGSFVRLRNAAKSKAGGAGGNAEFVVRLIHSLSNGN